MKLVNPNGGKPRVYLAGGKSEEWRLEFKSRFYRKLDGFDPMTESRQGAIYAFTEDDLQAVNDSQLVFGVVDYPVYTGMALEWGYAAAMEIPTLLVWTLKGRVDSMMAGTSTWLFTDTETAFDFVKQRMI